MGFSYQMVTKEINEILEIAGLVKTAAYEAGLHSLKGNEELCQTKLSDFRARSRELAKLTAALDNKIEYLTNQP